VAMTKKSIAPKPATTWPRVSWTSSRAATTHCLPISIPGSGQSQRPPGLVPTDRNNFGPRVGFAYNVAPKTVIRAGTAFLFLYEAGPLSINWEQSSILPASDL
jgi:hypothetical protein